MKGSTHESTQRVTDDLGDRVKALESVEARRVAPVGHPIAVRLDGRAFHSFTVGCERPFDGNLRQLMVETARVVALEANATLAYTQSDEITLILRGNTEGGSQAYFGGRFQKIVSCLAARASIAFNVLLPKYLPAKVRRDITKMPVFDCRAWSVPTRADACDILEWRETDARVNAIAMAARAVFTHRELNGKSGRTMQEMLRGFGIDFQAYPRVFRRGTYLQQRGVMTKYSTAELDNLPEKHAARSNPNLMVLRNVLAEVDPPPFRDLSNKCEFVFDGADPVACLPTHKG